MKAKKQVQTTCDGRRRTTGGSQRLQVPWELHFIRQQHRQRGVYQNWSRSSCVQETEQHLEVHNSQYQNQAQNLPVQRTFNSSLRLRDVVNQQEVGEQTSGLRSCLRRILKVRWQEKVCNEEIWRRIG